MTSVAPAAGVSVTPDKNVNVVISKGHAPVNVPDVTGMSFNDASTALAAAHFQVKRGADEFSNSVDKGKVTRSDPPTGASIGYGSGVTVYVSKGPDMVTVPNLINRTPDGAATAANNAGLNLIIDGAYPRQTDQLVSGQDLAPGTKVKRNSDVHVTFRQNGCLFGFICL